MPLPAWRSSQPVTAARISAILGDATLRSVTMMGSDARERLIAAFVSDALARALFEELIGPDRTRAVKLALSFLPPEPDASRDPSLHEAWEAARQELKTLGGIE